MACSLGRTARSQEPRFERVFAAPLQTRSNEIATYNIDSIRRRISLVLDWITENKPDVLCLQDQGFPADAFREAGYYATFRGMKGYKRGCDAQPPKARTCPDHEDVRIVQTVVAGIPIINSYVPQGYSINSEKYGFKLAWVGRVRRYFETQLDPLAPAIWLGDMNVAPEPIDVYHPESAWIRAHLPGGIGGSENRQGRSRRRRNGFATAEAASAAKTA